jgi:hypothetical protein
MDVKIAFLNWELEEEVDMDKPDEFVAKDQEGMVYNWNHNSRD